jgi:hypothetical protein
MYHFCAYVSRHFGSDKTARLKMLNSTRLRLKNFILIIINWRHFWKCQRTTLVRKGSCWIYYYLTNRKQESCACVLFHGDWHFWTYYIGDADVCVVSGVEWRCHNINNLTCCVRRAARVVTNWTSGTCFQTTQKTKEKRPVLPSSSLPPLVVFQ